MIIITIEYVGETDKATIVLKKHDNLRMVQHIVTICKNAWKFEEIFRRQTNDK